jgi:hypothetical protein
VFWDDKNPGYPSRTTRIQLPLKISYYIYKKIGCSEVVENSSRSYEIKILRDTGEIIIYNE